MSRRQGRLTLSVEPQYFKLPQLPFQDHRTPTGWVRAGGPRQLRSPPRRCCGRTLVRSSRAERGRERRSGAAPELPRPPQVSCGRSRLLLCRVVPVLGGERGSAGQGPATPPPSPGPPLPEQPQPRIPVPPAPLSCLLFYSLPSRSPRAPPGAPCSVITLYVLIWTSCHWTKLKLCVFWAKPFWQRKLYCFLTWHNAQPEKNGQCHCVVPC